MALDQYPATVTAPSRDPYPVTPSDTVDLATPARSLLIAVAGDIVIITAANNTRTCTVPAGLFPGQVTRVKSTGTTATGITALP